MKLYRNEWKYRVQLADLNAIESKVAATMQLDLHSDQQGKYEVHSLYFDDYKDACAKENEAGVSERYKYRIRYYGDNTDYLRLECKEKKDGRCYKQSAVITRGIYEKLLDGRYDEVYWETDDLVIRKFCIRGMTRLFGPKLIVTYERVAFVEDITNVRITMDKNIMVSGDVDRFITKDYLAYPIQEKKEHVLEVKFDDILPGYIKNIITDKCLLQSSFSKYYLGRLRLQEVRE